MATNSRTGPKLEIAVPAARKALRHPALVACLTQGTSVGLVRTRHKLVGASQSRDGVRAGAFFVAAGALTIGPAEGVQCGSAPGG